MCLKHFQYLSHQRNLSAHSGTVCNRGAHGSAATHDVRVDGHLGHLVKQLQDLVAGYVGEFWARLMPHGCNLAMVGVSLSSIIWDHSGCKNPLENIRM